MNNGMSNRKKKGVNINEKGKIIIISILDEGYNRHLNYFIIITLILVLNSKTTYNKKLPE